MSEATVQAGIQDTLQAMSQFADADVTINDWSILDQGTSAAPYVIIRNANQFTARKDTYTANTKWDIPIELYERFTDWPTTLNALRDDRQAIIDAFNANSSVRSAGLSGVTVDEIRAASDVTEVYPPGIDPRQQPDALPMFVAQLFILTAEEF